MRIREPRTTALVFSSGKMVCTGAKRFVNNLNMTWTIFIVGLHVCYIQISVKSYQDWLQENMQELSKSLAFLCVITYLSFVFINKLFLRQDSWSLKYKTWLVVVM